jgi:type I restriction enzyme M protein
LFGEVLHLTHILAQTRQRAAILVPAGFLFRTTGTEHSFKEQLLRQGWLQAVIGLPGGMLAPYTSIATALLLFDKTAVREEKDQRQQGVVFVDATAANFVQHSASKHTKLSLKPEAIEEIVALVRDRQDGLHSCVATIAQIAEQDFNLAVDRYVLSQEDEFVRQLLEVNKTKTIELEAIAEIYRPQVVPDGGKEPFHTFKEVALTDIQANGLISTPSKIVEVSTQNLGRVRKQQLQLGDILISIKGRVGTIGLVMPSDEVSLEQQDRWIAGQSLAIVRLRDSSPIKHPVVLFRYLASSLGQRLLQFFSQGLTVPMIQMGELRKLPIVVPSDDEQQEIVSDRQTMLELYRQIAGIDRQIKEIDSTSWPMSLTASELKS